MRPPTRALVLSLAVVLLAAPTEGAGSPVRVTVAQALDSVDFLLLYVARHLNTFQEEGLDARFIVMAGGGGPNLAAVLSGEAQFTASGLFTFLGPIRGGQPLVAVRSLFDGMSVNFVIRRDVAEVPSRGVETARAVYPPGERKTTGYGPEEGGHRHAPAQHTPGAAVNPHLGDAPHLASGADAGAGPVGPGGGGDGAFGAGAVPAPGGGGRGAGVPERVWEASQADHAPWGR
jgi:hypothetical protein